MNRLLVALDFSPVTPKVLEAAAALPGATSAEIRLLHVAADQQFVGYDAGPEAVRRHVASELRREQGDVQAIAEQIRGRVLIVPARETSD